MRDESEIGFERIKRIHTEGVGTRSPSSAQLL